MAARQHGTTQIFNNQDKLHPNTDIEPIGRNKEIHRIKEAIQPIYNGHQANHIIVNGPPGTGKTTCVKHARDQLANASTDDVYIKSTVHQTRAAVLTHLLKCTDSRFQAGKRGTGIDEKLDSLHHYIDDTNLIVILDECDRHRELDALLYDLMQINAEADNYIGIILITDQGPEGLGLEDRVWSRLNPMTVHFDRYGEERLYDIVEDRASDGFDDGVLGDGVISYVAEYVASDEDQGPGDVRCALDILRIAGQKAEREGKAKVTVADVEQVIDRFRTE